MKVWLGDKASKASGGMYRVYDGLYNYLPAQGIQIVPSKDDADILNPHIGMWGDFPADKPIVLSSHGMLWKEDEWGKLADKINSECLKAYRRADAVTAPSHFVARSISRYTGAKPIVAHHGIDSKLWTPGKSGGYVLWNKARADVASNPKDMNTLAEMAKDTMFYSTHGNEADNVYVFGQISPEDMHDMVSQAGVYLGTSKESGGPCFGVLEAMSCAVPVLAWNFGGTAEIIQHKETGYLAEPGNYDDLLEGLRFCIANRKRLGNSAREEVLAKYQWDRVIHSYVEAYDKALYGYNDTVSIIIPCYNLGKFLPYCLDSVLEQTYTNLEIVVIDDASKDNSWDIIQAYAKKDARILPLRNTTNQHVSASRNIGVEYSTGQFILPLDADDRLYPAAVENMVSRLRTDREIDIVSGKLHVYHETALEGPFQASGWPNNASLKLQLEGYNRLAYSSMYRRKVFDRVGGYRTRIRNGVEDADFWTRALGLGYKADILDDFTLKYTHRDVSLGKTNTEGSKAWMSWIPWTIETCPATATKVYSFSKPEVSIIIPVGPYHTQYVQACLDSVMSQIGEDRWEAILVNDSGKILKNVPGWVKLVEYGASRGVAYARNRGVDAASSDKIIFLDADDILQPNAVQALLMAHAYAGGWIYGDWYINKGEGTPEYSESDSWNYATILDRSLGPITGIYEKKHIQLVNGFTEELAGWEDWEFQLKLLHHGICGTRLKLPLIVYNMHLGYRREDNFSNRNNLLKYIREKHYSVLKEKEEMACSSCGGKRTLTIKNNPKPEGNQMEDVVLIKYLGKQSGRIRVNSRSNKGTHYIFNVNRPEVYVFKSDLEFMMAMREPGGGNRFELVPERVKAQTTAVEEIAPLISQELPPQIPAPIEELQLEEHVVEKLRAKGFEYITDIVDATDAELLTVKGIGNQRVEEIREAVNTWLSST